MYINFFVVVVIIIIIIINYCYSIGVETQMTKMSPTSPRAEDVTRANDELSCMHINYNFFVTLSMTQQ